MRSRHVSNAIALRTALFATVVMSMLANSAFAETTPKLTVLSERWTIRRAGARQIRGSFCSRGAAISCGGEPSADIRFLGNRPDLKAAGSTPLNQKTALAIYALRRRLRRRGPIAQMMAGVGTMSPAYVVSVGYGEGQPTGHNHRSVCTNR